MATVEVPQRMTALAQANAIRYERAALRLQVKAGELPAADVLVDVPECVHTLTLGAFLAWQTRWSTVRAERFCRHYDGDGLHEAKPLGSLTLRQRAVLAGLLIGGEEAHATLLAREANANAARREAALTSDERNAKARLRKARKQADGPALAHLRQMVRGYPSRAVRAAAVEYVRSVDEGEGEVRHVQGQTP